MQINGILGSQLICRAVSSWVAEAMEAEAVEAVEAVVVKDMLCLNQTE
jgi:hypothetical protein